MDGWAIDMTCAGFGNPYAVCKKIESSGIAFDQMIYEYGRWTHISFAPQMRQQKLTIMKPQNKYLEGILSADEYASKF